MADENPLVLPESVASERVSAEDTVAVAESMDIASPVQTASHVAAAPASAQSTVTLATSIAPSALANSCHPMLVSTGGQGTQLLRLPLAQFTGRTTTSGVGVQPVRILPPSTVRLLAQTSSSGVHTSVGAALSADMSGKQILFCQVSGGRAIILPQGSINSTRMSGTVQQLATVVQSSGQPVVRGPVLMSASAPNSTLRAMRPTAVAVSSSSNLIVTRTMLPQSSIRPSLPTGGSTVQLIQPNGPAAAAARPGAGVVLSRAIGPRFSIALAPNTTTVSGSSTGTLPAGVRFINLRPNTTLPLTVNSIPARGGIPSQIRLISPAIVTQSTTALSSLPTSATAATNASKNVANIPAALVRRLQEMKSAAAQASGSSAPRPATAIAACTPSSSSGAGTPLKSVATPTSLVLLQQTPQFVLQSPAVRGSGSLTQLVTVGKPNSGISQGATVYMITTNSGSNTRTPINSQALTAALARAKGTNISTAGRPKVVAIPGGSTIRPIVSVSGSNTIFVDARRGNKSESHQTKANRIVAEAIAKAQAEGLCVDILTDGTDGKKRRRKKGAEDGDEGGPPLKRKRPPRPRVPGRRGAKDDVADGMIVDAAADGMAVSEECEVLTSEVSDAMKPFGKLNKAGARMKYKKRRPLATFLKNKKKKKGESDTDESDMDTPTGSVVDEDTLQLLQTRRSNRVTKRKKYVDEVDLNLSDDDHSRDEDSILTADSNSLVNGIGNLGGPSTDIYQDAPAEEDSQIVDKVLAVRTVKKKVVNQRIEKSDDNQDVDIEGGDDKKELDKKTAASTEHVEEVDVEEFFVKYKNYSYMHCEWRTADELLLGDKRVLSKIKRFKLKKLSNPFSVEIDEDEPFNPDYVEVERVLDVAVSPDPSTGESVTHYLVSWRSLPYEDSTWELEQDVEQSKIDAFNRFRHIPPPEERLYKPRPLPKDWVSLTDTPVYLNDNVLRDYQLEGLNWLTFSYYNRQNCILADEMGLGKTIQSISFLKEIFDYGIRGPFLIVVPLSTLGNWQREFESWTDLNAIVYHGTQASRNMLRQYEMYYRDERGNQLTDVYKFHALITTYEVIISDLEELSSIEWRVAIIDEAHRLKNRNCKLLQGLSCFELEHRVLLTGTPLQNNVDELFSLLSFLEPRQFSSSEAFMAEFGRLETETQVDKLKALLKPMMLRRLKEDVEKTLASKEETIIEVELTNIQKKYYRAILERNFSFLSKGGTSTNLPNLMNTMMELRKCCNHPYLVTGAEEQILDEAKSTGNGQPLDGEKLFHWLVQSSGKLVLVDKLLPKLRADGHKVLIFSQMIRVLDIIEDYLLHRHYPYERIDGRIRGNLRQEAIDRFSKPDSDRFVFLLCTRAGGLGINLTAADTVIIFDSDWNPQNDLQAQARCHRIGQLKAVKVYRLITRNTYEREMFDRASLKLGLDKAVLQSTGQKDLATPQNQLSKKEIEDLLKKGAYGALMDDDTAGEAFCEEDIDHILQRRTQIIQIESGVKGSTFAKASFNLSTNRSDINIDDPNFWQKWAKKADIDVNGAKNDLIMELPRERKKTTRYGKQDMVQMSELDSSASDDDDPKKKRKKRRGAKEEDRTNFTYSRSECFKVEKNLLVYGWGRWSDIYQHACFKRKLRIDDVITITRAMLLFSLKHYEGDERIKKFIFDLISPSEDGLEKDYKNHSGLSAPVPRGRKGRKAKKDVARKAQFEEDLTKLDIDVDSVLVDDGYKKHLIRQSNKVLLRVRLLYYLKQEVIGRQAEKIFDGAPASEIDVPVICADVDIPVYWWDAEADRCLLVGVFKHGYEKFNLMRQDPCLCFLSRCGPPDCKALLAEQNDDDEMKELEQEEEEDEPETEQGEQAETPRRRGRRKKKKRSSKSKKDKEKDKSKDKDKDKDIDTIDTDDGPSQSQTPTKYDGPTEDGKLPFPTPSDLNTRFRRIITSFQRCHKQGMLKLEQISKKMHKREQRMERDPAAGSDVDDYGPPPSPSRLPSLGLDGVGSNPLLLAEQLHWTRREEADFYRVVSTFGVERDCETGQFIWDKFRNLAHLERKLDNTLTEYFRAFYHMCLKVCRRFLTEEEARPPNGLYVLPITEERANRCLARIDLLNKIREQILWHPWLDSRLALCQPSSYLPQWWICGQHDKDLLIGAAKHGVSHTETNILTDPLLSFNTAYQQFQEHMKEAMAAEAQSASASQAAVNGESSDAKPAAAAADVKSEPALDAPSPVVMSDSDVKIEPAEVKSDVKSDDMDAAGSSFPLPVETPKSEPDVDAKLELNCVDGSAGSDGKDPVKSEEAASKEDADEALENDESKALAYNWNYLWPKDRIIFYRLEHICHCIETGRWRMSHRHSVAMNETGSVGTSIPGTPVGNGVNGQDYSIIPSDEQAEGLKMTIHKKRHRRTKAEMEAGKMRIGEDGSLIPGDDSSAGEFRTGTLEGSETPPYARKKQYRVRRPKIGDDLLAERCSDPDSRIPVVSTEGQILTGDEAPMLRDLDAWLDAHPGFAPLSEVMGSGQKPMQRRRPRLDPTKIAVDQLTGNENVTVVNRNTGKRITGLKAPALRDLVDWLLRNPGFDVDSKWANIVHNTMHIPDELRPRILSPSTERIHRPPSGGLDPTASTSHDYHNSIMSSTDFEDVSDLQLQPFRSPDGSGGNIPLLVDRGWDLQPDDSRDDDDDSEDGYSDHELTPAPIPRHVSHLLTGQSAGMFNASQPYLCNSNVIDRICANIGGAGTASNCVQLAADRYLSGRDRFVADARIGNVIGTTSHHYATMSAVDNEVSYSTHAPLSGSGLQPALFDAASDDDAYADESQSANGEEAWQYVEEGEIELS